MGPGRFPQVIPQLDGVRAIAILLVLVCHAENYNCIDLGGWGKKGWIGVDLFFVLSGFLITGLLAEAKERQHYFRNFYGRRALRILPLYFVTLGAAYLAMRAGALPEYSGRYSWLPYVLLVQNLVISAPGFHALGATWSLAIEEQFYLVWPWLVKRLSLDTLRNILLLAIVVSPLLRTLSFTVDWTPYLRYKHTLLRLDGLAMGGWVALWLRSQFFELARLRAASRIALAAGIPLAVWLVPESAFDNTPPAITMSAVALSGTALLGFALLGNRTGSLLGQVLAWAPLRYVGKISYCLYLVHMPLLDWLTGPSMQAWSVRTFGAAQPITLVLYVTLTFGLATLSWYGFERPILRLKRHFADNEVPEAARLAAASV